MVEGPSPTDSSGPPLSATVPSPTKQQQPQIRPPPEEEDEVKNFTFKDAGSLGVEFEDFGYPFRIINLHEGLCKKYFPTTFPVPCELVSVNGVAVTKETDWDRDLVPQIQTRPLRLGVQKREEEQGVASALFSSLSSAASNAASLAKDKIESAKQDIATTTATSSVAAKLQNLKTTAAANTNLDSASSVLGTFGKSALQLFQQESEDNQDYTANPDGTPVNGTEGGAFSALGALSGKPAAGESGVAAQPATSKAEFTPSSRTTTNPAATGTAPAAPAPSVENANNIEPESSTAKQAFPTPDSSPDLSFSLQPANKTSGQKTEPPPVLVAPPADHVVSQKRGVLLVGNTPASSSTSSKVNPQNPITSSPSKNSTYEYTAMIMGQGPLGLEFYLMQDNYNSSDEDFHGDHRGLDRRPARIFVKKSETVDNPDNSEVACYRMGIRLNDELTHIDGQPVAFESLGALYAVLDSMRPVQCSFSRIVASSSSTAINSVSSSRQNSPSKTKTPSLLTTTPGLIHPQPPTVSKTSNTSEELTFSTSKLGANVSPGRSKDAAAASPIARTSSSVAKKEAPSSSPPPTTTGPPSGAAAAVEHDASAAPTEASTSSIPESEAHQMAKHWEKQSKDYHQQLIQLTNEYNSLVTHNEELETEIEQNWKQRITELEDMNLKWQTRYEKQNHEVERLQNWVNDHRNDAQVLQELKNDKNNQQNDLKLQQLEEDLAKTKQKLIEQTAERDNFEKQVLDSKQTATKLQEALDLLQNEHMEEQDRLQESVAIANKAKRALQIQVAELEETVRKKNENVTKDEVRSSTDKTRIEELENQSAVWQESCMKLRQERDHFSSLVDQCFEKMKRESQDRIYQVDRRIVCDSLIQFCKVDRVLARSLLDNLLHVSGAGRHRKMLESIDSEHHAQKLELLSKLADSLGFDIQEREQIGLNRSHLFHTLQNEANPVNLDNDSPEDGVTANGSTGRTSIGRQFVEYLEKEVAEAEAEESQYTQVKRNSGSQMNRESSTRGSSSTAAAVSAGSSPEVGRGSLSADVGRSPNR
ncbi:unnamed protein product [Amoebophrya sp. A120]|nr:unnamed protein product [Amoebophrya sp. A120]|eukprot:GSA120T00019835001.1